jgi:hypothetical protein
MTPTRDNRERGREEPPQQLAQGPPPQYPSGDYSYVLEIVMRMQDTMGQLREAVGSLKEQSKSHDEKLDKIGKDVHAAKVVIYLFGGLILGAAGFIAWLVNTYIATHPLK